ncbi:hypothetical protein J2Z21_002715 [Streptomyces griseochromogenes]|nr:hypothetical protein [Streptomyces griseochromogenes]MBP2049779.1 hypothetical protein [Streptomyces griseochromogenes]
MNTAQLNASNHHDQPRKFSLRMPRIVAVSAALGLACAAGAATATSAVAATPAPHGGTKAAAARPIQAHHHDERGQFGRHGGLRGGDYGDDDDCEGLIVLLCV